MTALVITKNYFRKMMPLVGSLAEKYADEIKRSQIPFCWLDKIQYSKHFSLDNAVLLLACDFDLERVEQFMLDQLSDEEGDRIKLDMEALRDSAVRRDGEVGNLLVEQSIEPDGTDLEVNLSQASGVRTKVKFKQMAKNADDWRRAIYYLNALHQTMSRVEMWDLMCKGVDVKDSGGIFEIKSAGKGFVKIGENELGRAYFNRRWNRYIDE